MQYQIPQNIEVEDKVIGPLTVKQFSFVIAGLGFSAGLYALVSKVSMSLVLKLCLASPPLFIFLILGFMKFNGRELYRYLAPFINYLSSPKQRIWKREEFRPDTKKAQNGVVQDTSPATKAPLEEMEEQIEVLSERVDTNSKEPKTIFEVPAVRDKSLDRVINKNTEKVEKTNEPLVSQIASVSPDKKFSSEIPKVMESKTAINEK